MRVQGKVWGTTSPLFNLNNVEIHHLNIHKGGYCSQHRHIAKFNKFIVLKGSLAVVISKDYGTSIQDDRTVLSPGQELDVRPGEYHYFEALEDSEVLEVYWVSLEVDDIDRRNHGGANFAQKTNGYFPQADFPDIAIEQISHRDLINLSRKNNRNATRSNRKARRDVRKVRQTLP